VRNSISGDEEGTATHRSTRLALIMMVSAVRSGLAPRVLPMILTRSAGFDPLMSFAERRPALRNSYQAAVSSIWLKYAYTTSVQDLPEESTGSRSLDKGNLAQRKEVGPHAKSNATCESTQQLRHVIKADHRRKVGHHVRKCRGICLELFEISPVYAGCLAPPDNAMIGVGVLNAFERRFIDQLIENHGCVQAFSAPLQDVRLHRE
jgi:hypothetical protein